MQPLAIKYRPEFLDEVVGQDSIKVILSNQVKTGTFKHAYLFTGPAGCGKTTVARIFADMLNEGEGSPYEIDAASNNGVDDVREIRENAKRKSLDSKYKIYIIDECHMLSSGAWNALLKTLEDTPKSTIFILCTTNPEKVPATIMSRVQRYDYQKIPYDLIVIQLKQIIDWENEMIESEGGDSFITYEDEAIYHIAKLANGGMRDAITMLDKCISYSLKVTLDNVLSSLGQAHINSMFELMQALSIKNITDSLRIVQELYETGIDLSQYVKQFQFFLLDVGKAILFSSFKTTSLPDSDSTRAQLVDIEFNDVLELVELVRKINISLKWESHALQMIQTTFLLYCMGREV